MKKQLLLTLLLSLATSLSHAGFNKCTLENGRIVFSDKPCESGKSQTINKYDTFNAEYLRATFTDKDGNETEFKHAIAYWNYPKREIGFILSDEALDREIEKQIKREGSRNVFDLKLSNYFRGEFRIINGFTVDNITSMKLYFEKLDKDTTNKEIKIDDLDEIRKQVKKFKIEVDEQERETVDQLLSLKVNHDGKHGKLRIDMRQFLWGRD